MALAALLGVSAMFAMGVLNGEDTVGAMMTVTGPLALLFGGMVTIYTLSTSELFERIGAAFLRATQGSGKRFLLLLIALGAPCASYLPPRSFCSPTFRLSPLRF
jgi:Na+/H+ antiporter NhaD/arsenite permease-like protein